MTELATNDAFSMRPVLVTDDPAAARRFEEISGSTEAVIAISEAALRADWPEYVVARARTGGAMAVLGAREGASVLRLAEGVLLGRPAVAGLVGGALVFIVAAEARTAPVFAAAA